MFTTHMITNITNIQYVTFEYAQTNWPVAQRSNLWWGTQSDLFVMAWCEGKRQPNIQQLKIGLFITGLNSTLETSPLRNCCVDLLIWTRIDINHTCFMLMFCVLNCIIIELTVSCDQNNSYFTSARSSTWCFLFSVHVLLYFYFSHTCILTVY